MLLAAHRVRRRRHRRRAGHARAHLAQPIPARLRHRLRRGAAGNAAADAALPLVLHAHPAAAGEAAGALRRGDRADAQRQRPSSSRSGAARSRPSRARNGRRRPRSACRASSRSATSSCRRRLRIALAPTVGMMVVVLKGTALTALIGFVEVTRAGQLISGVTFQPLADLSRRRGDLPRPVPAPGRTEPLHRTENPCRSSV